MAALLLLLLLAAQQEQQPATALATTAQANAKTGNGQPLNMVILVDESASESPADVSNEARAASTIAQSLLSPDSRVSIVGFAGPDPQAPMADPTTIVCPPTVTSGTGNLESLARCVSGLKPRTITQGWNTDYFGAIGQALSILSAGVSKNAINVVLMMTDGGLDEAGNHEFPQPDWQTAAHHAIDRELAQARQAAVAVWPLGFGNIDPTDQAYLQHLAQGGSQVICPGSPVSHPQARIVQNSAAALAAFNALYSAAACTGTNKSQPAPPLSAGHPRVLTVTIPPIASTAAISVFKANPSVRADFIAPGGIPVPGGSLGGSAIEISGADTPVEVLHVTNPPSGPWQIRLTAPPGRGGELVSATVFWQGEIRTSVTASPGTAAPGQQISVTLTVLGRNRPIVDPLELRGVRVQVSVSGDGLPSPIPINLTQGSGPGAVAGDFTGTFKAPTTKGTLTVTGTAIGYGLHATMMPAFVNVASADTLIQATVAFTAADTVRSGSVIRGQVAFDNRTGQSQRARLVLSPGVALATIASPTGELPVRPGRSVYPFAIDVASGSPTGPAQLSIAAVNAARAGTSYGSNVLVVTITRQPTLLRKYLWELIGAIAILLLIVGYVIFKHAQKLRTDDVHELTAVLRDDHGRDIPHNAPGKRASEFSFAIVQSDDGPPRFDNPSDANGEHLYVVRRANDERLTVKRPGHRKSVTIRPGEAVAQITNSIKLIIIDGREKGQAGVGSTSPSAPVGTATSGLDDIFDN